MTTSTSAERAPTNPLTPLSGKVPVIEIFGPTIQGEGRYVGMPCTFLRLGGCDYRCSWCDSLHAVLVEEIKKNATKMSQNEIFDSLMACSDISPLVVISGGNPAIHGMQELSEFLQLAGKLVSVETQGTVWRPWLNTVNLLTLSPKPPSSGMKTDFQKLFKHVSSRQKANMPYDVKIVIFNDEDLAYAKDVFSRWDMLDDPLCRPFLSVGTEVGKSTRDDLLDAQKKFLETSLYDPILGRVSVMPQVHVLLWSHVRGV